MGARKRVLVLAYFFPPLGGGGVPRTLKFIRYLEPLGWDATVITTNSLAYRAHDASLLEEVPAGTRVIRTGELPLLKWIGLAAQRLGLDRLRQYAMWPDGGRGWAPLALVAAHKEIRRQRPDVILSTSAPAGAHLAAIWLSRRTGIPWVADFRDEWSSNPASTTQPERLKRLAARAERAISATASRVVVAADRFELAGMEENDPRRFVILNGVDPADLPPQPVEPPSDRFVLAHVGTVYESRNPSPVLRVIANLAKRGEIERDRFEIRFVGSIWHEDFAPPNGIRFESVGYLTHSAAVREMHSATALLLFVSNPSLAVAGKLFEYLASGRPLLCVTSPDNFASRLVREWDAGVTADPDNPAEIEAAIVTLWRRWQEDGLTDQAEVRRRTLERYSRQTEAAELAHVLDEATRG
jgi:glycosyltransferase involved in cell wall biosynthesis